MKPDWVFRVTMAFALVFPWALFALYNGDGPPHWVLALILTPLTLFNLLVVAGGWNEFKVRRPNR